MRFACKLGSNSLHFLCLEWTDVTIQILSSITDATTPTGASSAHDITGASAVVDAVDVKVTIPGSTRSDLPTYQNQVREKLVWKT